MQEKLDFVVVIGRFQPYHLGHKSLIQKALSVAKNKVIVLIGSASSPRSIKNPFTFEERKTMIKQDNTPDNYHIDVLPIEDSKYNDLAWVEQVQLTVQYEVNKCGWTDFPPTIGIIGLDKDQSTVYLKWFPQWKSIEVEPFGTGKLDATSMRHMLFGAYDFLFLKSVVPESTFGFFETFSKTQEYIDLIHEYKFIQSYKKSWEAAPYPPIFTTVDAVVFQSGHVLLIKRGASPGKGLWALPGGFVNQDERLEDAAIRELREETRLKVPEPVLRGSIFSNSVFDHPDRSLRGRTITHAFGFSLASVDKLPPVKGGDDAAKAKWFSLSDIKREEMYEDHFDIVRYFVGRL